MIELGIQAKLLKPQIKANFDFLEEELSKRQWFAGSEFTAADIQMSYPLEAGKSRADLSNRPHILKWLDRIHVRPAYRRAIARGGPTEL